MKEELNKLLEKDTGFYHQNKFELVDATEKEVTLKAPITEKSKNAYQIAHGGFIFGLGDHAMGILSSIDGRKSVTLNANINYISPGLGEFLTAKAEMIKKGKKTCFLKANIYNSDKKLVATMESTYFYIDE